MSPTGDKSMDSSSLFMDSEDFQVLPLESRSFRTFKSSEDYLEAMKEDLAEWLNTLYGLQMTTDNFMDKLETGHILCRHANNVLSQARNMDSSGRLPSSVVSVSAKDLVYKVNVKPKTFQARDNVSNFISWCRQMQIHECLLFETDDLVLRKNERSFILCLLEVARKGTEFGLVAPLLVQMEQEIDRELEAEWNNNRLVYEEVEETGTKTKTKTRARIDDDQEEETEDGDDDDDDDDDDDEVVLEKTRREEELSHGKPEKIPKTEVINHLKDLQEKVADLLSHCSCPTQFPMIKVADGKYRIGDTKTLIFVRILRNHVMVRVGGGWDTLEHYLYKHDPCRCRSGHKFSKSTKLTLKSNKDGSAAELFVTFDRARRQTRTPNSLESESTSPSLLSGSTSRRSSSSSLGTYSMLHTYSTPNLVHSYLSHNLHDMQASRISQYSDDSSSSYISNSSINSSSYNHRESPHSPGRLSSDEELWQNTVATDSYLSSPPQLQVMKRNVAEKRPRVGKARTTTQTSTNATRKSRCRSLYLLDESREASCGSQLMSNFVSTQQLHSKSVLQTSSSMAENKVPCGHLETVKGSRIPTMTKVQRQFYLSKSTKDLRTLGRSSLVLSDKFGFRGSVNCLTNVYK